LLNKLLFLKIVIYFVNSFEKYYKVFIILCIITNYNKNKQFSVFFSVFQDYNIVQKFEAIINNNINTNDILCIITKKYLFKKKEIK
jgi:hypothetical protein